VPPGAGCGSQVRTTEFGGSTFEIEDLLMASFRAHEFAITADVGSAPARNIFSLLGLCAVTFAVLLNVPHNSPRGVSLYNHVATTIVQTVEKAPAAVAAVVPAVPVVVPKPISQFRQEAAMSSAMLMKRWDPLIAEAARQFRLPAEWIRAVMRQESGGRTMLGENQPIRSKAGAMGLMQLMPGTYKEMRVEHSLGADPYNPHDNVMAGAAYLRQLRARYGFPAMFAAYNFGPGAFEGHLEGTRALPAETQAYIAGITASLGRRGSAS
jgi:soluble lytic murein transglycosylase-like protein